MKLDYQQIVQLIGDLADFAGIDPAVGMDIQMGMDVRDPREPIPSVGTRIKNHLPTEMDPNGASAFRILLLRFGGTDGIDVWISRSYVSVAPSNPDGSQRWMPVSILKIDVFSDEALHGINDALWVISDNGTIIRSREGNIHPYHEWKEFFTRQAAEEYLTSL